MAERAFSTSRWWTTRRGMWYTNLYNKVCLQSATKVMFRLRPAKSYDFCTSDNNYYGDVSYDDSAKSCGEGDVNNSRRNDRETRTWRNKSNNENVSKNMNVLQIVFSNLSVMSALGICVITGHVTNDVAGPAVISSLIIAAVTSLLSGLCYTEFQTNHSHSSNNIYGCFYENVGEFPAFLVGWNQILLHVSAIAAVGRSLSAVLDYISGHQLQEFWLERLPKISAFNANPDLIAFSFVVIATLPFGLGMKWPKRLKYLITVLTMAVAMLFVIFGAHFVDSKGWSSHHFLANDGTKLLSGAGVYTSAFCSYYLMTNSKPQKMPRKCVPIVVGVTLTVCFITYFTVAIVSTLLVKNRNVDSDVSLVEVFQTYNLRWAVFVMGAGDVLCLGLLLLNLANNLNLTTLMLAFDGLIFRCISRKCKPLKTPLVPALLFGSLAAISAILFPIQGLLEVMTIPSLIINTFICLCVLHQRYQPIDTWQYIPLAQVDDSPEHSPVSRHQEENSSESDDNHVSNNNNSKTLKEIGIQINKRDVFPMVKQTSFSSGDGGSSEDGSQLKAQTSFDSDISMIENERDESDDDSSATDIDTIVAEYKEKLRVATLTDSGGFNMRLSFQQSFNLDDDNNYERCPTAATGRRVFISVVGLVLAYFILSFLLILEKDSLASGNPFIIIFLSALVFVVLVFLIVILRQPEVNHGTQSNSDYELPTKVFQVPFLPWIPAIAAFLNVCMITNILCSHWISELAWTLIGLAIYFLYGIHNSSVANVANRNQKALREKIRLKPLPRQPFLSSVLPVHDHSAEINHRITEVDTILISR